MIDPETHARLRARFSPDGSDLRNLQLEILDILKYVDKICRDNDIKYWLSSGTCLGAVRHGGFIPWDDDADIELLRPDYEKLCRILKADHSSGFVLQDHSTDFEYVGVLPKLRNTKSTVIEDIPINAKYDMNGIFIDILCIEPSNSKYVNIISHKMQLGGLYYLAKINNNTIRRFLIRTNMFILTKMIYPIMRAYGRIGNKKRLRHSVGSEFTGVRMLDEVSEIKYVPFENTMLPIPKNAHAYLTRIFGDYMNLPSEEEIHPHMAKIKFHTDDNSSACKEH